MGDTAEMALRELDAVQAWMDELGRAVEGAGAAARERLDAIEHRSSAWIFSDFVDPALMSTVVLLHAPLARDATSTFSWLDDGGWHGHGAPPEPLRSFIEGNWARFRANAVGRVPELLPPNHMCRQAFGNGEVWFTASSLTNIEPAALVALHDREDATPVDATPPPSGPHIGSKDAGGDREDMAIRRWLHVSGRDELPAAFGWDPCCWIGIGLSRALVFDDDNSDGDVDLVVGRMRWDMTTEERDDYFARERREAPLLSHESNIRLLAALTAASDGRLTWDDSAPLVALEAKASWYDSDARRWKRTHGSSGAVREILGNLKMLRARGFDRTALLHLAATAPRVTEMHPWFQASRDLAAADADAEGVFPLALTENDLGGAAYLVARIGAVPGTTEEFAGVGGRLEIPVPGAPLVAAPVVQAPWRKNLVARLAALGRPRFPPPVFVSECRSCRRWLPSGSPDRPRHDCIR